MPQLSLYIDDELKSALDEQARKRGLSLSKYVTELVEKETGRKKGWPKGYFDKVLGSWEGELERHPQGVEEVREGL